MSLLTPEQMWSLYLFNQITPPIGNNLLNENLVRPNVKDNSKTEDKDESTKGDVINISSLDFMESNAGKYITGAYFDTVKYFPSLHRCTV